MSELIGLYGVLISCIASTDSADLRLMEDKSVNNVTNLIGHV